MTTMFLKVLNVVDTTAENGKSSMVNLSLLQSPNQQMSHMNFTVDVTNRPDDLDFYKSNVGKVFELPVDLKTLKTV